MVLAFRINFSYPPRSFTILILVVSLLFAGLGIWQVKRLAWKEDLIASIEANRSKSPIEIINNLEEIEPSSLLSSSEIVASEFRNGYLRGKFLYDKVIYFVERSPLGAPGVHVFMVFMPKYNEEVKPEQTRGILINRGWIPFDVREHGGWKDLIIDKIKQGETEFIGTIRYFRKPSWVRDLVLPDNSPATNTFFRLDPIKIEEKIGLPINNFIYMTENLPPNTRRYPIAGPWEINITNNHLIYLITWFSLSLLVVVLWISYGITIAKKPVDK